MKFHSGILGLTLTSVVALTSANAADIYVPGPGPVGPGGYKDCCGVSWAGFYLGAHVGGAWGDLRVTDVNGFAANATPGTVTKSNPDGVFGGGTFGWNGQRGNIVFGVEVDLGDMDTSAHKLITGTASSTRVGLDGGFYGDVTGRLGYSWGPTLIYAKGGFAFLDANRTFSSTAAFTAGNIDTFTGWTVGGGLEYLISPSWSLKVEYLHFDFGNQSFALTPGTFSFKEDLTVDTVKVGVNYHFHGDYVPLK